LVSGASVVSFGVPPLMPWGTVADVWLALDGERIVRVTPRATIERVETLGGEPWARMEVERGAEMENAALALAVYETTSAAYLAAAGRALVDATAEHARTRQQFGRPIGDFQAVAHPLADCAMRLTAAATLARAAACRIDEGDERARGSAAAARLSASRAALDAARVCHQTFGAMGVTEEGPVFPFSRRIRQLASLPPPIDADLAVSLSLLDAGR
jgi:alkylation response protein AidB-like acyl-CoA dehydrogenase